MRVIGGFDAQVGTNIGLRISDVGDDVSTFAGILKKFDEDGGGVEAKWSAAQLQQGVTATLGNAHGYDVIILPVSKPSTNPSMTIGIKSDDPPFADEQSQDVGDNIPFGYRIFIQ